MFADYLLAAVFDCQMCRTSAIRGSLKQTSGVRSRIAALPRTEDISQIDPCSRVRLSFRLLIGAHVLSAVAQHRLRSATATAKSIQGEGQGLHLPTALVVNRKSAIRAGLRTGPSMGLNSCSIPMDQLLVTHRLRDGNYCILWDGDIGR